jgi:hypothetical protein
MAVFHQPAIEPREITHAKKGKQHFGGALDVGDQHIVKTWRAMIFDMAGRQVFVAKAEHIAARQADFGRNKGDRFAVGAFQHKNGKFLSVAIRFDQSLGAMTLRKNRAGFFQRIGGGLHGGDTKARSAG